MANAISANQLKYLTNMANGKMEDGSAASAGKQTWAKEQLANSSYTSALNNVKSTVNQSTAQAPAQASAQASAQTTQQPVSRTNQTLNQITGMNSGDMFQFKAPAAFSYDKDSDPAYLAALESARANITQGQADTNARLRAGGQGKSSYSESVANQISAGEMGRVSREVLPQLISQAYQRYSDGVARDLQIQQANYGVTQDRLSNLANQYSLQNQQDFNNPLAEAELTGNYLPGEARQLIDSLLALKGQAETQGTSAADMANYRSQGDAIRAQLQSLGIDTSGLGADINRTNAALAGANAGTRTLAAQAQDYRQQADTRDFNEGVRQYNQGFEYTQGRDAVKDAQWQKEFDRILKNDGVDQALAWAANSVSRQNAATSAGQLALSRERFSYDKEQDALAAQAAATSNKNYKYQTDPSFAEDIAWINSNPAKAAAEIKAQSQALISQYGYDGYQALLKAAESGTPQSTSMFQLPK